MVDDRFLSKLSQNLLEILDDDEYYDITIEVGNDPFVKIFRAHMVILNYRSPYLRRILSTNKKENDGTLTHIKLPNLSPEIFQIILRYIYSGRLSLEKYDPSIIVKILIVASELSLQELITYLQSFLIKTKANWMEQNFKLIYQTSFENDSLLELQKYCTDSISKGPDKIFKSPNFSSIPEKVLVSLIQSDNLQLSVVQVWEHVLKWGFDQNPELSSDPTSLSKDDFNTLKNTLQQCIPFIKFYNLTSREFLDKVLPYKKVLPKELYKELIKYFLNPNINQSNEIKEIKSGSQIIENTKKIQTEPQVVKETKKIQKTQEIRSEPQMVKETKNIQKTQEIRSAPQMAKETENIQKTQEVQSEPQMDKVTKEIKSENIDSEIISNKHATLISKWIDNANGLNLYSSIFSSWIIYKPKYEFKLLLRGSRDGFTPCKFHEICDNKSRTVIIIKVKGSKEILGGYNPVAWKSDYSRGTTKDSFIFSFKNQIENHILSRVKDEDSAILNSPYCVPQFGNGDLVMLGYDYDHSSCIKCSYENPIRKTENIFSVEEYEVFQIVDDILS